MDLIDILIFKIFKSQSLFVYFNSITLLNYFIIIIIAINISIITVTVLFLCKATQLLISFDSEHVKVKVIWFVSRCFCLCPYSGH